jgi:hypothetical protein
MYEKDGDSRKRANFYLSLRFRSIHLSSFDLSAEDPDNPSLSASPHHSFFLVIIYECSYRFGVGDLLSRTI